MNKQILKQYDTEFYKLKTGRKIIRVTNRVNSYIFMYRIAEDVEDILSDINLALEGRLNEVVDPYYIGDGFSNRGELTSSEFIIYSPGSSTRIIVPLNDFKELLSSWKEYLEC